MNCSIGPLFKLINIDLNILISANTYSFNYLSPKNVLKWKWKILIRLACKHEYGWSFHLSFHKEIQTNHNVGFAIRLKTPYQAEVSTTSMFCSPVLVHNTKKNIGKTCQKYFFVCRLMSRAQTQSHLAGTPRFWWWLLPKLGSCCMEMCNQN